MNSTWQNRFNLTFRTLVYIFAVFGLLVFTVSATPVVSWLGGLLAGPWNDPQGDILIVLGGDTGNFGMVGMTSYLRSKYAVAAYREGGFHAIVLTGGGKPTPIATEMRNLLVSAGVPPAVILTETASTSTRENALFTKRLLAGMPGKRVLLTSDYHMFRAHRAFRKVGLDVAPRPIPDARKRGQSFRGRWPALIDVVTELMKIPYYFAREWI